MIGFLGRLFLCPTKKEVSQSIYRARDVGVTNKTDLETMMALEDAAGNK
jgi:hypothetical protein